MFYGYVPNLFKRELIEIIQEERYSKFIFKTTYDKGDNFILVDESKDYIELKIELAKIKAIDKIYLSNCMRDINLEYLGNGKWQIFDEYNIYEFKM